MNSSGIKKDCRIPKTGATGSQNFTQEQKPHDLKTEIDSTGNTRNK